MVLKWTSKALSDLTRLYDFLLPVNKPAAIKAVRALVKAPDTLLSNPRIGEQLFQFAPSEVRRILVGQYDATHLARYFWKPYFWSRAYGIVSTGGAPLETVRAYIQNQEHPAEPATHSKN